MIEPGDLPDAMDMRIESEESEVGLKRIEIYAKTEQAQIDLAMEYPRIVKLLSRDWAGDEEC